MSHENVELVRGFFEAYNARDSKAVDRLLHPEAEINTLTGGPGWQTFGGKGQRSDISSSSTKALTDFRIEIEDYRDLGERVVALGAARGAGVSSHIEVASDFAVVFVVRNSQLVLVDTYDNPKAALEAAGLSG